MYYKLKREQTQSLKNALHENCHRVSFLKSSWNLWSKSLKITLQGFILVKNDFFLRILEGHYFFYSLFGKTFHLETSQLICICIDWFLSVTTSACINSYYIIRNEESYP